ncbi:unnamed protein product [Rotaria socialis]|uniref:Uncharacterized protein n=1 Tax=Rotaria socialis TaxID=392032 RepID=A0A821G8Y3_9BILA|nr:unnamed protein product [Rotaria socialis]CAF4664084.1 unnamed protein product [Rotaria socialis]
MSKSSYLHHSSSRRSRSRSHHSSSHRSHHSSSRRSPSHQQHRSQYSTTNSNQVQQSQHYSSPKTTSKSNQIGQPHAKYSTFNVHSSDYEIVFINNETSSNTINKLLNHVNLCKQYSIDTESERANNQLSLIQMNSIPIAPPSIVMLFELKHLPDRNSQKYANILQLFQIIFRSGNEIYSWGNMQLELEPAKEFLVLPIAAMLIDIQPHFSTWYTWARTQCWVQRLSYRNDKINDNEHIQQHNQHLSCDCHPPSPYKINELWSLQNSIKYACNLFLDKSCRLSHWSSSLTSRHSSLSHVTRTNMIHYATHDVMAVTLLIRPITERWTFEQIKLRKMNQMFVAFDSIKLPPLPTSKNKKIKNINMQTLNTILRCNDPDVEDISSDDEIYFNQLVQCNDVVHVPVNNDALHGDDLLVNNHYMVVDVTDDEATAPPAICRKHQHRSDAARQRRNRKRNYIHRLHRYFHILVRRVYHRFIMSSIKKILRQHHMSYRHIKIVGSSLIIGVKNSTLQQEFDRSLRHDLFDRTHYFHYRRRHQSRHHHHHHHQHH